MYLGRLCGKIRDGSRAGLAAGWLVGVGFDLCAGPVKIRFPVCSSSETGRQTRSDGAVCGRMIVEVTRRRGLDAFKKYT